MVHENIDGLVKKKYCGISSSLLMEISQSCAKPSYIIHTVAKGVVHDDSDGLVQYCISTANTLEILQSCAKPLIPVIRIIHTVTKGVVYDP